MSGVVGLIRQLLASGYSLDVALAVAADAERKGRDRWRIAARAEAQQRKLSGKATNPRALGVNPRALGVNPRSGEPE